MTTAVEGILKHYGVKGMRWGVRKSDPGGGSDDHRNFVATKNKARSGGGTKALSNRELQEFITRANLERQYKMLAPTKSQQVTKFLAETLIGVGKDQARKVAADFAAQQVAKALKK